MPERAIEFVEPGVPVRHEVIDADATRGEMFQRFPIERRTSVFVDGTTRAAGRDEMSATPLQ